MRVSIGAGTPELYQELLSLDDAARCERMKHLATLGLMYLSQGQQPVKGISEAPPQFQTPPSPAPEGLSGVVKRLKLSLDDLESRP